MVTTLPKGFLEMAGNQCPICFTDKKIFQGKYPINYRLVIIRAIYSCKKVGDTNEAIKDNIQKAKQFVSNLSNPANHPVRDCLHIPGFIELCVFYKHNNPGLVMIDRSKGCFPLVAYPDNDTDEQKGDRVLALKYAFDDIYNQFPKIIEFYNNDFENSWEDIKLKFKEIFNNYES